MLQVLPDNAYNGQERWSWPQVPFQAQTREKAISGSDPSTKPEGSLFATNPWVMGITTTGACACLVLVLCALFFCVRHRRRKAWQGVDAAQQSKTAAEMLSSSLTTKHMHARCTPAVRTLFSLKSRFVLPKTAFCFFLVACHNWGIRA